MTNKTSEVRNHKFTMKYQDTEYFEWERKRNEIKEKLKALLDLDEKDWWHLRALFK